MACSSNNIIHSSTSSCSSSSALIRLTRRNYYDVFVSFRGKDTRYNFTDHLFASLRRKGIIPFRDDTKLKKGESIAPELLRAIEASKIFIVVFSMNYASSTWCLRELEHILCCVQLSGKRVLPIFYDVDPSEVRYQKGGYGEAFVKHEQRFKQDFEMLRKWREALTQVANLSGWDVRHKPQSAEIEKIVDEIINILDHKFSSLPDDLVGMRSPIGELEKLLSSDSVDDVKIVGICGMGGIGKTTLAIVLYGGISHQFDACCFIDDLSKTYREDGLIGAQKQILHQTLGEEHLNICNPYNAANLIHSRLRCVKVLIILDNVDQFEQLEKLVLNRECLGAGSRIVVISRDKHILKEYVVDVVYNVPLLNETNSLQLFCRKAFKLDRILSNYEELAYDMLNYANGLPLAIKVLGSLLFGRDISEWRSALARLRECPNKDIMDVLRLSFDGLEEMEKEIFLDIACFFIWKKEKYVKNILSCCGFHPDIGLRVLTDKSLISIHYERSSSECWIVMHDLLEALGRNIVKENSIRESRKWSRLWLSEYFYNVMLENKERNVKAIVVYDKHRSETEICMAEALSKMSHLRLLVLKEVKFSKSLQCLSNELRYVDWHEYPFMYLPSKFQPNQLVELYLKHSNIRELWEGKKYLPNLRTLDLRHSKSLIKMPEFGDIPNLKRLNLEGCVKLVQMDPSIGILRKLVYLNLKDCKNLRSIPSDIFGLSSLEDLKLSGCSKVFNNPNHLRQLISALHSQSTSSIFKWIVPTIHSLFPKEHKNFASCLLPSLHRLSCLRELDISFCGLSQIPDAIGYISCLQRLNLGGNYFVTLPSLKELSKLVYLNFEHCKLLKYLPTLPSPVAIEQDLHWGTGLYIYNCPELSETELCSSISLSWMMQFIQAYQDSSAVFYEMEIVIPGNQIPSWFNNQIMSTAIRIDLSPILHDNNFIGLVCCVLFSVPLDYPSTMTNECEFVVELWFTFGATDLSIPVILNRDIVTVKLSHLWLMLFTRELFFNFMSDKEITQEDFRIYMNIRCLDVEVKNCGYRWLFKRDLQLIH